MQYKEFRAILIILVSMALSGCVPPTSYYKSPQMTDANTYVRQHKGEGLRRVLVGSEAEFKETAVKEFSKGGYTISQEPHAVFARSRLDLSYAFYFYPTAIANQTEVEVLMACPVFDAEHIRKSQADVFSYTFALGYIKMQLLQKGYDPNVKDGWLPLSYAATSANRELANELINRGANIELAINDLKELASKYLPYLDKPLNKEAYDNANQGVIFLNGLKRRVAEKDNDTTFEEAVRYYHSVTVKPELPENARKFKVQAEGAVRDKDFAEALYLFGQALKISPWWPEGHYNRALVFGELKEYDTAIIEMKRYIALVPNAPKARAAQDKIYDWERKVSKMQ